VSTPETASFTPSATSEYRPAQCRCGFTGFIKRSLAWTAHPATADDGRSSPVVPRISLQPVVHSAMCRIWPAAGGATAAGGSRKISSATHKLAAAISTFLVAQVVFSLLNFLRVALAAVAVDALFQDVRLGRAIPATRRTPEAVRSTTATAAEGGPEKFFSDA
jgi:hypothetical protein